MQKLVDVCRHPEEVELLVAALAPWVVHLSTDANGNHVIQRCLQHLPVRDRAFIIDAVKSQCLIVARHRHGCCVLQRCLDAGTEEQREALTAEVVEHALLLMQVCKHLDGGHLDWSCCGFGDSAMVTCGCVVVVHSGTSWCGWS